MIDALIQSYEYARQGFPVDRVLADPALRKAFINRCKELEISSSDADVCRTLLNARKRGLLSRFRSKRTTFRDSEYRFAAEIALRHLERRHQITLDDILCEPTHLSEFDRICCEFAPGYEVLRYRWAALSLRKSRSVPPEVLGHVLQASRIELINCSSFDETGISPEPGIYIFISSNETLYVGEASNLKLRLKKHLEHSDNKSLARYLWEYGADSTKVEVHYYPTLFSTRVRRAIELELIRSRQPSFNVIGNATAGPG